MAGSTRMVEDPATLKITSPPETNPWARHPGLCGACGRLRTIRRYESGEYQYENRCRPCQVRLGAVLFIPWIACLVCLGVGIVLSLDYVGFLRRLWYRLRYPCKMGIRPVIGRRTRFENTPAIRIGALFSCGDDCFFAGPLQIGNQVSFNNNCHINGGGASLSIGNDCLFGPNVVIRASGHNYNLSGTRIRHQGHHRAGVVIEDDVWVGANAVVLPGVRLHQGAVVGAGAVVTHDVPEYTVVAGVPAVRIAKRGP